ncbi:hypothetical protein PHYSODRAFT_470662, partial [Phytophthora sojae]
AYAPEQREFKSWCDRKGFHETTRYQVTASKLHLFLQDEVVDREVRRAKQREYVDRGAGSLLNGYCTTDDLVAISRYYMNLNTGCDLRDRMIHFLCHACLLRSEATRNLELSDLFSVILEHEGYTDCRALVMIMEQGKTNPFGRREFGSCIHHRNVDQKNGTTSTYSSQAKAPLLH